MIIALKLRLPVNFIVKRTIFKQFCGGETIDECTKTIHALGAHQIGTILDYSVEGKIKEDDFDQTAKIIIQTIKKAASEKSIPFAVFKITGISEFSLLEKAAENRNSLTTSEEKMLNQVKSRINDICLNAKQMGVPVFIDAEESWVQDIIDQWAFEMMLFIGMPGGFHSLLTPELTHGDSLLHKIDFFTAYADTGLTHG